MDMVRVEACNTEDEDRLLALIHEHQERTGSARAKQLIEQWEAFRPLFKKVVPNTTPLAPRTEVKPTVPAPEPQPEPVGTR
jgi:glutamate synthase domain-containing protein 3